jgi:beta-galactosidase
MANCGLSVVQTYVAWNLHEPRKGEFNFEGIADIERWLQLCQQCGMHVILRPGPYICAEWDLGGLPYWLITDGVKTARSMDEVYIKHVDDFLTALFARVGRFMCHNGGPILMVQVENEYGAYYPCDHAYMKHLCDVTKQLLGEETVLFTTDQPHDYVLECGAVPSEALVTLDFGIGFEAARMFRRVPNAPPVNSEFYPGWLDHWREPHQRVGAKEVAFYLEDMLKYGASVNFYMFIGGTNFGFYNGANGDRYFYQADPTSYDYDAPLSEAGDMTWKYQMIRDVIQRYRPEPLPNWPVKNTTKKAYGKVRFTQGVSLFDTLETVGEKVVVDPSPQSFERLDTAFGFVLYETETNGGSLKPLCVHDRADVLVDKKRIDIIMRNEDKAITIPKGVLSILVENMGRLNYGYDFFEEKGLLKGVKLNTWMIYDWKMTTIPLKTTEGIRFGEALPTHTPAFYRATFHVDAPADTFLNPSGFDKGVAFVNGFNLGRYWTVGPQLTLYVPAPLLRAGENELIVFEVGEIASVGEMSLDDTPQLDTCRRRASSED